MKRVLIIGGSGFLGGHLVAQAKSRFQVVTTYFEHEYRSGGVEWEFADLTKIDTIESVINRIKPQIIIHSAALSNIDECENKKEFASLINYKATEELAVISFKNNIRFIFVSSDMVYDGEKGNYIETDEVNPINFYGDTKVMAEKKIREICTNYVIARAALIYGTSLTQSRSFSDKILHNINNRQHTNLFYDQFRTPILVDNLAEALIELCELPFTGTLNLGGSEIISRYDFGVAMADIYNFPAMLLKRYSMNDFAFKAKRPRDVSFNIAKAQNLLSTKFVDCKEGLKISCT